MIAGTPAVSSAPTAVGQGQSLPQVSDPVPQTVALKKSPVAPALGRHGREDRSRGLYPVTAGRTRLVSRVRACVAPTARGIWLLLLLDPGQCLMERKMLLGIKQRAECSRARSC